MLIQKHTSSLSYICPEYCLIWAAGVLGGPRGDVTGVGNPLDALENPSSDFGASHLWPSSDDHYTSLWLQAAIVSPVQGYIYHFVGYCWRKILLVCIHI